jgi:hypothetical protein
MPTRDGTTIFMSTEWAVEVFDWDQETPQDNGGATANTDFFKSSSIAKLGSGGKDSSYAFLDKDILTSVQSGTFSNRSVSAFVNSLGSLFGMAGSGVTMSKGVGFDEAFSVYSGAGRASSGIVSISFSRGKASIDNKCTIILVGPLPAHTRSGNWVVVNSIHATKTAFNALPRFVGQIQQINTEYNVLASGAIVLRSVITVAEWSNLLLSPVVFDMRTAAGLLKKTAGLSSLVSQLAGGGGENYKKYADSVQTMLNPYTASRYFLRMIGMINELGGISMADDKPWKAAATLPDLPAGLLKRLGHDGTTSEVFSKGFVKIIAGRVKDPSILSPINKGSWNGFFGEGAVKFKDFVEAFDDFKDDQGLQPLAEGVTSVAQLSSRSVWDMIQSRNDPQFNESFTDMYYEIGNDESITTSLCVVVRGKMFKTLAAEEAAFDNDNGPTPPPDRTYGQTMISDIYKPQEFVLTPERKESGVSDLKKTAEAIQKNVMAKAANIKGFGSDNEIYATWNYYDDIPRIYINGSIITGMSISNTFMSSPNLFFLGYVSGPDSVLKSHLSDVACQGTKRHNGEMLRFGSNIVRIVTRYLFSSKTNDNPAISWYETMMKLVRVWDGYNYRMASGVIRIKDYGIPLSVGMNIRFDISGVFYVAHIDGIDVNFNISPDGIKTTSTAIKFSRLMQEGPNGKLIFCAASSFGDLWNNNPHKSDRESTYSVVAASLGDFGKGLFK